MPESSLEQRMNLEATKIQVAELVQGMGQTADEVADTLKYQRVHGFRNAVRILNPVVRFVRTRLHVDALGLDVMQGDRLRLIFQDGRIVEVPLPKAVVAFLQNFNQGAYPELLAPNDGSEQSLS